MSATHPLNDRAGALPARTDGSKTAWVAATATAVIGLGGGALSVFLGGGSWKPSAAVVAALAMGIFLLLQRDVDRAARVVVALFALSIPFNVDVNFAYRPHVGGAPGVTVTVSLILAAMLFALQGMRRDDSRRPSGSAPGTLVFLLFPALYLIAGILSLLNAADPAMVLFECTRVIALGLVCFVFLRLRSRATIETFLLMLTAGLLFESVLAIAQHRFDVSLGTEAFADRQLTGHRMAFERALSRATGTIGHPNVLGYYLEILIPLVFALFMTEARQGWRVWYLVVFVTALLGIVATLSRGAWLTLLASIPAVLVLSLRGRWSRVSTMLGLVLLVLGGLGIGAVVYPEVERRIVRSDYRSAESRMPLNEAAFSIVTQHPVVGIGLNNFEETFKSLDTTANSRIFKGYRQVVHNMYLLVWAEVGTFGLLAFVGMLFVPIWTALSHLYAVGTRRRGILLGVAAGMGAHMLHGLFDPGFRTQFHIAVLLFALAGTVGAVAQPSAAALDAEGEPT